MTDRPTGYLSPAAAEALRHVSTATLTSQLLKRGFRNTFLAGLAPIRPDLRMVGYAFTLRYIPMREDLDLSGDFDNRTNVQRLAVESVGPGDVLVIDARGETGAATLGNILTTRMRARGAAGIVSDGAFRDSPAFKDIALPTYARAAHATQSSMRHHPADLNVPIGCAGVAIVPGDVLVGDAEGVVALPRAVAEECALAALEQERLEEFILQKIEQGAGIVGVYPPDERTRAEYEAWRGTE
ncbi:MAG TPA: ribonuclease activity regulator RraA [Thermomicrobiales bacterium]|nr:ribonuclease activity regulator RraA [Thermomicrobiales bacterium]